MKWETSVRKVGHQQHVENEYFHTLPGELKVYFKEPGLVINGTVEGQTACLSLV